MPLLGKIALGIFTVLVSSLLLWIWFSTYYRISGEMLHYRSGPIHGTIPIQQIREVALNKYLWSGIRPALGFKGLVVRYNKWDEIYFSPAEKEIFLKALQEANPAIVVK